MSRQRLSKATSTSGCTPSTWTAACVTARDLGRRPARRGLRRLTDAEAPPMIGFALGTVSLCPR